MGNVSTSKPLTVPAAAVWQTITDPNTWDSWLTIHAGWLADPPAVLTPGAQLVQKVVMLGMANKIEWVVDTFEPETKLTISGKGMAGVKSQFSFNVAPDGDGCVVTIDAEFTGSLIVGALGKAVEKDAIGNLDTSLEKLATTAATAAA